MKFCPQCGTTFEPDARFCLECGFDKSSVESSEPIVETQKPTLKNPAACPQCKAPLAEGDRFCQECGHDSMAAPLPVEPLSTSTSFKSEEKTPPLANKLFCSKCGAAVEESERFCPVCGETTKAQGPSAQAPPPQSIFTAPPPKQTTPTKEKAAPKPAAPAPEIKPTVDSGNKKSRLKPVLIALALLVVGAGGWLLYKHFNKPEPAVVLTPMAQAPETPSQPKVVEPVPTQAQTSAPTEKEQPKTSSMSRMDQALAKQKAKQPSKPTPPSKETPPPTQEKPKLTVKPIATSQVQVAQPSKVLFEVGRSDEPKFKNPRIPTKFTLKNDAIIIRITTDHYNGGVGTSQPGTITIKDLSGNIVGTFNAVGKTGTNGTPNAKWIAEPHKKLSKGSYLIVDSDNSTWSKNILQIGFAVVEGYEE